MQNNLILLPHEPTLLLQDLPQKIHYLSIMSSLLEHFQLGINAYQNGHLSQFDAQVGDTLCQIRAYKIHFLATSNKNKTSIELVQLKSEIHKALTHITKHKRDCEQFIKIPKNQRPSWVNEPLTLIDLFAQINALIPVSDNALFLFLSHYLCYFHLVDEEKIPSSINVPRIASEWGLSLGYAKKITHYFQKKLAKASCVFIFEILSELPKLSHLQIVLPLLQRRGDEGRMVLPCHAVTEIIVQHMIQSEARTVLIINIQTSKENCEMVFHLQGNPSLNEFVMYRNNALVDTSPCMVFYGTATCDYLIDEHIMRAKIQKFGLSQMLLTNNAAHPQYSGKALLAFRVNPYTALLDEAHQNEESVNTLIHQLSAQLNTLRNKAHTLGLTQDNASFYFLKHIFCSTTQEYLNVNKISHTVSVLKPSISSPLSSMMTEIAY